MVHWVRHEKVMLDADSAELYNIKTNALNLAVKRNELRFPADFMSQLTATEAKALRSQIVTLDAPGSALRLQNETSKIGRGGRRYRPYVFTEQGVAMLSSVLRSPRAVQVNIAIMRAFVRLREMLLSNADLARKLNALEAKYDEQFRIVFDAIRELMIPPAVTKKRIGFHKDE